MRDAEPQVRGKAASLVLVGNGSVAQAKQFYREMELSFTLLTDPEGTSYASAGLRRGLSSTFSLRVLGKGLQAYRQGYRQTSVRGDPVQQGGAFVIGRGGELRYQFVSQHAGDHPGLAALLAAL